MPAFTSSIANRIHAALVHMISHWDCSLTDGALYILCLQLVEELGVVVGEPGTIIILPKTRQTAIFSATHTKKVGDLARLSFQNTPVYIDVDFGSFRNYYRSKREEFLLFWKENMFLELHEHVVVPAVELLYQLHFALQNGTVWIEATFNTCLTLYGT
nr:hypothetical protein [Tanacetum cinerariifolium]